MSDGYPAALENDIAVLKSTGFDYIMLSYEEVTSDREKFFRSVLDFFECEDRVSAIGMRIE